MTTNSLHEEVAREFVHLINNYDVDDQLDLRMGGEGDAGEILAEIIHALIDIGLITLTVNTNNER